MEIVERQRVITFNTRHNTDDMPLTRADLAAVERAIDQYFEPLGIDVVLTSHFRDRIQRKDNESPITFNDLRALFKAVSREYGQKIKAKADSNGNPDGLLKNMATNDNIPFTMEWDSRNNEWDLVSKTIMRKRNFHNPNRDPEYRVFATESDTSYYPKHVIDTVEQLIHRKTGLKFEHLEDHGLFESDNFRQNLRKLIDGAMWYQMAIQENSAEGMNIWHLDPKMTQFINNIRQKYPQAKNEFEALLLFIKSEFKRDDRQLHAMQDTVDQLKKDHDKLEDKVGKLDKKSDAKNESISDFILRHAGIINEKKDAPSTKSPVAKIRDPHWTTMMAIRSSGASGNHGNKKRDIPRKTKHKGSFWESVTCDIGSGIMKLTEKSSIAHSKQDVIDYLEKIQSIYENEKEPTGENASDVKKARMRTLKEIKSLLSEVKSGPNDLSKIRTMVRKSIDNIQDTCPGQVDCLQDLEGIIMHGLGLFDNVNNPNNVLAEGITNVKIINGGDDSVEEQHAIMRFTNYARDLILPGYELMNLELIIEKSTANVSLTLIDKANGQKIKDWHVSRAKVSSLANKYIEAFKASNNSFLSSGPDEIARIDLERSEVHNDFTRKLLDMLGDDFPFPKQGNKDFRITKAMSSIIMTLFLKKSKTAEFRESLSFEPLDHDQYSNASGDIVSARNALGRTSARRYVLVNYNPNRDAWRVHEDVSPDVVFEMPRADIIAKVGTYEAPDPNARKLSDMTFDELKQEMMKTLPYKIGDCVDYKNEWKGGTVVLTDYDPIENTWTAHTPNPVEHREHLTIDSDDIVRKSNISKATLKKWLGEGLASLNERFTSPDGSCDLFDGATKPGDTDTAYGLKLVNGRTDKRDPQFEDVCFVYDVHTLEGIDTKWKLAKVENNHASNSPDQWYVATKPDGNHLMTKYDFMKEALRSIRLEIVAGETITEGRIKSLQVLTEYDESTPFGRLVLEYWAKSDAMWNEDPIWIANTLMPSGMTLLHKASLDGEYDVVRKEIEAGCDVNLATKGKETPLHLAINGVGDVKVIELLVHSGANPTLTNKKGETPVEQFFASLGTGKRDRHEEKQIMDCFEKCGLATRYETVSAAAKRYFKESLNEGIIADLIEDDEEITNHPSVIKKYAKEIRRMHPDDVDNGVNEARDWLVDRLEKMAEEHSGEDAGDWDGHFRKLINEWGDWLMDNYYDDRMVAGFVKIEEMNIRRIFKLDEGLMNDAV